MSPISWYLSSQDTQNASPETAPHAVSIFSSTADIQLRFLCPEDLPQVRSLCQDWFPIQYPEQWYQDITSDPRFYSLAAVYQTQLVGLLIAEVKHCEKINKEVNWFLQPHKTAIYHAFL